MQLVTGAISSPPDGVQDHPDHDFYQERSIKTLAYSGVYALIFETIFILFLSTIFRGMRGKGSQLTFLVPSTGVVTWLPLAFMLNLTHIALFSLLLGNLNRVFSQPRALKLFMFTVYILIVFAGFVSYNVLPLLFDRYTLIAFGYFGVLYILFSFVYIVGAKRKPWSH